MISSKLSPDWALKIARYIQKEKEKEVVVYKLW